jgi:hypothetical protein
MEFCDVPNEIGQVKFESWIQNCEKNQAVIHL